jgi:glycosyltransferase involved in cell wall biosynthesis
VTRPRLIHVFPSFSTGGPEVRTATLINTLTDFEHTVISLNGNVSGRARLSEPVPTVLTPDIGQRGLNGVRELGKVLRDQHPDLLITYGWGGTDAIIGARLAGLKAPLHIEDGFLPDEAFSQKFARKQVRRLAFHLAAGLLVPSRTLERIATGSWWLRSDRVHYIPNGVDTERFAPASLDEAHAERRALGVTPDTVVVGTVGMLRPDKNHARLIRVFHAIARHRPAHLVIVGEGSCRPALERLSHELGLDGRVTFAGAAVDPAHYYRGFDIFALSSDTEQMPLSILEAMASGLPVVSTDVGDVADMIGPPAGGLVTPRGDDRALEDQLALLCGDEERRKDAGRVNRARALDEFSLAGMIESYRQVFRRHIALNGES